MGTNKWLILRAMWLAILLCSLASCNSGKPSSGVASIDEQQASQVSRTSVVQASPPDSSTGEDEDISELTDEEITTRFTTCLRGNGFNIGDPELNADGTVNQQGLRLSVMQDPKFQTKGREALRDCLPLLRGATFAQPRSSEDEIELQDNLLEFVQCLRDHGIDVPDPEFSNGARAGLSAIFPGGVQALSAKVQDSISSCSELIFTDRRPVRQRN